MLNDPNLWFVVNNGEFATIENVSSPIGIRKATDTDAFDRDFDTAIKCIETVMRNKPKDVDITPYIKKVSTLMLWVVSLK